MSSRPLNETPWDKKEDREKGFRRGGGLGGGGGGGVVVVVGGSYGAGQWEEVRGATTLSPAKLVESQMPLYPWPHCAFASESLSSISLIRGVGGAEITGGPAGTGLRWGLPGWPLIALMLQPPACFCLTPLGPTAEFECFTSITVAGKSPESQSLCLK